MEEPESATSRPWPPALSIGSTNLHYWINWRVLLCAFWVLSAIAMAAIAIFKHEGLEREREKGEQDQEEDSTRKLCDEDCWKPCLDKIHPLWLLAFRVLAFSLLSALLCVNLLVQGGEMLYFYTQWTFALVIVYFSIGSLLSCYGCMKFNRKMPRGAPSDSENTMYVAPRTLENGKICSMIERSHSREEEDPAGPFARFWAHAFQIIFQVSGGAVILTDCVFWLIIVPFLAEKDYNLNFFMGSMHSLNSIFLLGDTALNSMRFPWFRISYFFLWTAVYVIFQWVIHASTLIWWPYPFLNLSSPYAPLWYFIVAAMHFPCYAVFQLLIKAKHLLLSRWFPQSYQSRRH